LKDDGAMKSRDPKPKKKLKLRISDDIPFKLIGISSHENDYRLVWAINNTLGYQFVRTGSLTVHRPALNADLSFNRYTYTDEDKYLTFHLISNSCAEGFLFHGLKNLDYLLQVNGVTNNLEMTELIRELKSVEVISACFLLDPAKIKGILNILPE